MEKQKQNKEAEKVAAKPAVELKDPYAIVKYPLSTEKSIRLMESENKLIFVVDKAASKPEIKKAIEGLFKCKVQRVNTLIKPSGTKQAFVQFTNDTPAIDIATNLGLM